jgi:hypothetical protein
VAKYFSAESRFEKNKDVSCLACKESLQTMSDCPGMRRGAELLQGFSVITHPRPVTGRWWCRWCRCGGSAAGLPDLTANGHTRFYRRLSVCKETALVYACLHGCLSQADSRSFSSPCPDFDGQLCPSGLRQTIIVRLRSAGAHNSTIRPLLSAGGVSLRPGSSCYVAQLEPFRLHSSGACF